MKFCLCPSSLRIWILSALLGTTACVHAPERAPSRAALQAARAEEAQRLVERANEFSSLGDHTRAEQYLNAALARGADEQRVLPLLVQACIADQRYRQAAQYLENYLRRHPARQDTRFLLASLHLALGEYELAKKELETVVTVDPGQAEAHFALAVLLRDELGDFAAADRHFRAYLEKRPNGPHAEEARGSLLITVPGNGSKS